MKKSVTKADALLVSQFTADKTNEVFWFKQEIQIIPGNSIDVDLFSVNISNEKKTLFYIQSEKDYWNYHSF
jgi:hypothetical protein